MSKQHKITAFFGKAVENVCTPSKTREPEDISPVKHRRQRRFIIESDDEEDNHVSSDSITKDEESTETYEEKKRIKREEGGDASVTKENFMEKKDHSLSSSQSLLSFFSRTKDSPGVRSSEQSLTFPDVFMPNSKDFHPLHSATWGKGSSVPFSALSQTLQLIEEESKRLEIIKILRNYFRSVIALSPTDLLPSIYICLNKVAPDYDGIEIGIGDSVLLKALSETTGCSMKQLKTDLQKKGDIGLMAESHRASQMTMFAPKRLTVFEVFKKIKEIASMFGKASQTKKVDIVKSVLVACRGNETRYFIRSLSGKLRVGIAEQSLLVALGQAMTFALSGDKQNIREASDEYKTLLEKNVLILKTAYAECPDYDKIVPALMEHGFDKLSSNCKLCPGIPLKPMLAQPTKGIDDIFKRFEEKDFACEYKYDGERAQIHILKDGCVEIFSRNSERFSSKYPDIVSNIPAAINEDVVDAIIDSETVAYDVEKKQILPFQTLSHRKRKNAISSEVSINVCVFAFDLLYLNGTSLIKSPFKSRRELLRKHFKEVEGKFYFVTDMISSDFDSIQGFLENSVKDGCEGLMVKSLTCDATYEIAKRSHSWLKLKKDYINGIGDTLDLVVIGAYSGTGKRTGLYGGFLLACYDNQNGEYQSICKIGTGFKDEDLNQHAASLKHHIIDSPKSYYNFDNSLKPDVWFEPVQVWEVKCADLSVSPVHFAALGLVDSDKGISLRFPRFIRVREDKQPEDATSADQVAQLYFNQMKEAAQTNKD